MTEKIQINNSENQDPNSTPPRSPVRSLKGSPTTKSMWDSGDPSRNPPPLPASPQMVRITGSRNKNNLSPNSVGKLQFATVPDNSEIELQLDRIINAHTNLRSLVVGVDTSVKQTQLDLESLVERSSNNNSHLKDLVQSVKTTLPAANKDDSSNEKLEKLVSDALDSFKSQHQESLGHNVDIIEKLDNLKVKLENGLHEEEHGYIKQLQANISSLLEKLETVKLNQSNHFELIEKLGTKLESGPDIEKLYSSIDGLENYLTKSITGIHSKLEENAVSDLIKESIKRTDEFSKELKESNFFSIDELEKALQTFTTNYAKSIADLQIKAEESNKLQIEKLEEVQKLQNSSNNDIIQIKGIEENIINKLTENSAKSFRDLLQQIESSHEESSRSYRSIDSSTFLLKETFEEFFKKYDAKYDELKEFIESKASSEKDLHVNENQKLQLQLKDKEIEELKAELAAEKTKNETQNDILDLTKQKVKVETQLEALNETYIKRFNEFKGLTSDYEQFQTKISTLSLDKIKNIYGAATIAKLANEQTSTLKPNSPRKNPLANRVLSTNSYLNSNAANLTPKSKKKYEFETLDQFEEKENL